MYTSAVRELGLPQTPALDALVGDRDLRLCTRLPVWDHDLPTPKELARRRDHLILRIVFHAGGLATMAAFPTIAIHHVSSVVGIAIYGSACELQS
jgi:hypothetical protein